MEKYLFYSMLKAPFLSDILLRASYGGLVVPPVTIANYVRLIEMHIFLEPSLQKAALLVFLHISKYSFLRPLCVRSALRIFSAVSSFFCNNIPASR